MQRWYTLAVVCCSSSAAAQFPPGMLDAMPKKAKPAPLDADVPFIKCGACQLLAEHAYEKTLALLKDQKPAAAKKRRLESRSDLGGLEEGVETMLQSVCDSESPEGSWIREYDIVKADTALTLKRMAGPGKCRRECKTIDKACTTVLGILEEHDLGETLIEAARAKLGATATATKVCTKLATVCKKGKVPLWKAGRVRKNEEFVPLSEQDLNTEKMMAEARKTKGENGLPMTAMSADDIDLEGFERKADPRDELKDEI